MSATTISTSMVKRCSSEVKPGKRGECRTRCEGEVMVMFGAFGLIMCLDDIDHPGAEKTGGPISVHKAEVVNCTSLMKGDRVSFYLYADEKGLGAESCTLEQRASAQDLAGSCQVLRGLGGRILAALNDEVDELGPVADELSCPTTQDIGKSSKVLQGSGATILDALNGEADEVGVVMHNFSYLELAPASDSALLSGSDSDDGDRDQYAKSPGSVSSDGSTSAGAESDSNQEDAECVMPWAHVHARLSTVLANIVASDDEDVLPWANVNARISKGLAKAIASDEEDLVLWGDIQTNAVLSDEEGVMPWADLHAKLAKGLATTLASVEEDAMPWANLHARISKELANAAASDEEDVLPCSPAHPTILRRLRHNVASNQEHGMPWADVDGRLASAIANVLSCDVDVSNDDSGNFGPVRGCQAEGAMPWTKLSVSLAARHEFVLNSACLLDDEKDDQASIESNDSSGNEGDLESNDGDNHVLREFVAGGRSR